jgi:hypothetical protein
MQMAEMNQVFVSNAPWIVNRPVLLEYALEDFLSELGRQRPWTRSHTAVLLEGFAVWLEARLGQPATLGQVSTSQVTDWLATLPSEHRSDARDALTGFAAYLTGWGWIENCPWTMD